MSEQFEQAEPSYTPLPYDGGDSTSIPPDSPHPGPFSTTATVHADPLLTGTAFVVYICVPTVNSA